MIDRRTKLVCLLGCALSGCAGAGSEDAAFTPSLPPLESIVGSAPGQGDIPDDVKSDGPLPASYSELVDQQSAVRQQGNRGVCTIFASTALLEHLAIRRGVAAPDYSEQFLQWTHKAERPDPDHSEGSDLGQVMNTLATRGSVDEAMWPYQAKTWRELGHTECVGAESAMPMGCFTNGVPPAAALAAARQKLPVGRYLRNSAIKSYLYEQKSPVAVGLEFVDEAWSYPPDKNTARPGAWERGEVPFPSARELAAAKARARVGHAVLIVGWDDDYAAPVIGDDGKPRIGADGQPLLEKGFYIVKNSWGTTYWGKNGAHGAGYGMLSQRYVGELGTAYVVGLPTGAPPPASGEKHDGRSGLGITAGSDTSDVIDVAEQGPLSSALVSLAIAHPKPSALKVTLAHEQITWTLWDHNPGTQPIQGNWNLDGGLERMDRSGPWTLTVEDDAGAASGTLTSWSLTFK